MEEPKNESHTGEPEGITARYNGDLNNLPGKKSSKLMLILLVLPLIAAGIVGFLWQHNKNNNSAASNNSQATTTPAASTTPTITPVANPCPGKVHFSNKSMGTSFCYPVAWGDYTVENDKLASADTGTRLIVNFSKKSSVHVAGASTNYSTKVGQDGTCADPSPTAPDFTSFSTDWQTDGSGMAMNSASRDIIEKTGSYLINEFTDSVLSGGVCLQGFSVINGSPFKVITASDFASFGKGITTVKAHVDNPNILLTASERADFKALVTSIKKL